MLPLCVAAEKQTVKHGGGIVMLQKVGHAAQGEGNCRAGGTRCCSERKLQAVQRFLPGYDIIASRLDFSVWKRMKNLAGNLQPLIYGAFPVWRNCTVRAHICNLGASEWRKRKNGVEYAWTFRRVGHGVGQAGFHRFSRSAFPKMVYIFIGKILLG